MKNRIKVVMKLKQVLLSLFLIISVVQAYATNNQIITNQTDTVMEITTDHFDFEEYNLRKETGTTTYTREDGTKVRMSATGNPSIIEKIAPPSFVTRQRQYYSNGILRQLSFFMDGGLKVGIWRTYDERGNLIKEVDEDAKFGKIKPQDILNFLDKEGYINVKTGEGRFDVNDREVFKFRFRPTQKSVVIGEPDKDPLWSIMLYPTFENGYIQTEYIINGETGQVLEKKVEKIYMQI